MIFIGPHQKRFTIETFQPSELLVLVLVARSERIFYELAHEEIWCFAKDARVIGAIFTRPSLIVVMCTPK